MLESRMDLPREILGHARWLRSIRHAKKRCPDIVSSHDVALSLGSWATPDIRAAIYESRYESREVEILAATLDPGDRYLEVGVGVGVVTVTAARVVGSDKVVGYDADPRIVNVARDTAKRNGVAPQLINAALMPTAGTVKFHQHQDFWRSRIESAAATSTIDVPALARDPEIEDHRASYLMLDIEGAEIGFLEAPLPGCVVKLCVECHPAVTGKSPISAMIAVLLGQGFDLDVEHTRVPVLYFSR